MTGNDGRTAGLEQVRASYGARAREYIDLVGSLATAPDEDRALIAAWAAGLDGPVLDAGCGPGHWSAFLASLGLEVDGVDAAPAFVAHARQAYPAVRFREGDLRHLRLAPGSLGGVLAWFSLIHADPEEVPAVLARFAEALRPGGSLLLGFFSGPALAPFDHRVVTAWAWPPEQPAAAVRAAGLQVLQQEERPQPSGRIWASLVARKPMR